MIKEKFLEFLCWFKEHFHVLLEVVLRLSVGLRSKQLTNSSKENEEHSEKEEI